MAQSHERIHTIVVDNNSSDNSLATVKEYASLHKNDVRRFTVLEQDIPGASAARNLGAQAADTEWIMFFDSDDAMRPDLIEKYVNAIKSCKEHVDIICSNAEVAGDNGKRTIRKVYTDHPIENHIMHSFLATQRYIVRKDYFDKSGGWNEDLRGWLDWELGLRLLLPHPEIMVIDHEPASVIIYPQKESITGTDYSTHINRWLDAINVAEADAETFYATNPTSRPSIERIRLLLDYKRMALAGLCKKEGNDKGIAIKNTVMNKHAKSSKMEKFIFQLIYHHTASGIKGSSIWTRLL